jgi:cytochrome b561
MLARLKAWTKTHTSKRRYSPVGIAFHWGMALIIVVMLWLRWVMGCIDPGSAKPGVFERHMTVGLFLKIDGNQPA